MADRINSMSDDGDFGLNPRQLRDLKTTQPLRIEELQDDEMPGRAFSLEDLMSGDTFTATTETLPTVTGSTELALNYDDMHSLAFFASVYTRISIALQRVQEQYPNGFLINQITSGVT